MIPLYHYMLFMHVCMITVSWRPTKRATNAVWLFLYKPKTAQMFLSQRGYKQSLATALTTLWLGLVIPEWPAAILAWPWPGFLSMDLPWSCAVHSAGCCYWTCPTWGKQGPAMLSPLASASTVPWQRVSEKQFTIQWGSQTPPPPCLPPFPSHHHRP